MIQIASLCFVCVCVGYLIGYMRAMAYCTRKLDEAMNEELAFTSKMAAKMRETCE